MWFRAVCGKMNVNESADPFEGVVMIKRVNVDDPDHRGMPYESVRRASY